MLNRYTHKDLVWIDLVSPTPAEIQEVTRECSLDPTISHELLSPTLQPHADIFTNHIYLVLHFPILNSKSSLVSTEQEIDFVIGKNVLITTRYEDIEACAEFRKVFEFSAARGEESLAATPFALFSQLARRLYKGVESEIYTVREKLEYIEKEVFEGYEKEMVVALSHAGRDILNLKQALDPHQEILRSLIELTEKFAGIEEARRMRLVENLYYRSKRHITRIWQTLAELRETNNSLLSTKQNEVMKVFTILAFVTFPLSLVASIFGMNTHLPFNGNQHDFWIIMAIMGLATGGMFLFFKHRKWL